MKPCNRRCVSFAGYSDRRLRHIAKYPRVTGAVQDASGSGMARDHKERRRSGVGVWKPGHPSADALGEAKRTLPASLTGGTPAEGMTRRGMMLL